MIYSLFAYRFQTFSEWFCKPNLIIGGANRSQGKAGNPIVKTLKISSTRKGMRNSCRSYNTGWFLREERKEEQEFLGSPAYYHVWITCSNPTSRFTAPTRWSAAHHTCGELLVNPTQNNQCVMSQHKQDHKLPTMLGMMSRLILLWLGQGDMLIESG